MSERIYTVKGIEGEFDLEFSSEKSEWRCLCTWPACDGDILEPSSVRSLALLGAAVVLVWDDKLEYGILPNAVPEWIREEIKRIVPVTETCRWALIDDDCNSWETSCGDVFHITNGDPADNGMRFCPYCGLALEQESQYTTSQKGER